jgi:hypothetical protein
MRNATIVAVLLALVAISGSTLEAQTGTITAKTIAWRSSEAMSDGLKLLDSGARLETIAHLISCLPNPSERVSQVDRGFFKVKIRITDGAHEGCVGWVPAEHVSLR